MEVVTDDESEEYFLRLPLRPLDLFLFLPREYDAELSELSLEQLLELVDEPADEDERSLELEELEDSTEDASESLPFIAFIFAASASACIIMSFGAFFKYSLSPSVKGPRPILVKKLIAYLVFLGLSFGNNSLNHSAVSGSSVSKRFTRVPIPIASAIS